MNADFVFVLDATATMGVFIDRFRREFLPKVTELIREKAGKADVRYKIIVFRDYGSEGAAAMKESKFFAIPEEMRELEHAMLFVEAGGGGDSPENGLEAIYYAMKSDFASGTQTIFFFTDADAVKMGARKGCEGYPEDMTDEKGLKEIWLGKKPSHITQSGKKLILVAPENTAYSRLAKELDNTVFVPAAKSGNLNDIEFSDLLKKLF